MPTVIVPPQFPFLPELGQPLRVYRYGTITKLFGAFVVLLCLLFALALAGYAAIFRQLNPDAPLESQILLGIVAVGALGGAIYFLWYTRSRWNEVVVLYDNGFAYRLGSDVRALKWTDVAAIRMHIVQYQMYGVIPAGASHDYRIKDQQGRELKLSDSLPKVGELAEKIRAEALPHIMHEARRAFDAGETVQFGPLHASKIEGVGNRSIAYEWNEIGKLTVTNGRVEVKPKKGGLFTGFSVRVADVPNVEVFLTIAADVLNAN